MDQSREDEVKQLWKEWEEYRYKTSRDEGACIPGALVWDRKYQRIMKRLMKLGEIPTLKAKYTKVSIRNWRNAK